MTKTKKWKIISLFIFIAIFVSLLIFLFSGENFNVLKEIFNSNASKEDIQSSIGKLGIKAYIVVAILAMFQVVFTFIPAEPLHVISGISFGLFKGIAVCFIGILIGNTLIFLLNKIYGKKLKDFFATNVDVDFNLLRRSKRIALIVIILYCLPAIPYGIICFFAASIGMKYSKYILITAIGSIPSLVLDVGLGHVAMSTSWIISLVVLFIIFVLLLLMFKFKNQLFAMLNNYIKRNNEKNKNKVGNYNPIMFNLCAGLVYGHVRRKTKIKFINNVKNITTPCIVLCNHGSFYDFIYAGKMLKKYKPHFVVARMYFHNKYLNKILNWTGAFPKSMFTTDLESTKNCLKVLNGGGMLAMMPEARLSTVGKFESICDSTYKFIQKANVAVYTIKINGSYFSNPKWGNGLRKKSFVEVELNELFAPKQTQNLSLEEIKSKIDSNLYYNDYEWLKTRPNVSYKSKEIAQGLENILCVCPNCGNKYSLKTEKNQISCEHCDLKVTVTNRYNLIGTKFNNIQDWYDWQKDVFKNEILSNENFNLSSKVELRHLSTKGNKFTKHAGFGKCVLDKNGLTYIGDEYENKIEKHFPIQTIYRLLFGAGEDFEIYEGSELYYFVPHNKRSCVAWYIVSEILKDLSGENNE